MPQLFPTLFTLKNMFRRGVQARGPFVQVVLCALRIEQGDTSEIFFAEAAMCGLIFDGI
jgi:hypothetical protein